MFAPFRVLPKLEKELPFRFKNKEAATAINPLEKQRVAILREPKEAKVRILCVFFYSKLDFKIL